jgi:CRISPR-associated protein Cas5d
MEPAVQVLDVWGEFACFSQPAFKVERFSYPVITPSAARGIYDAISCAPDCAGAKAKFRWEVTQVEILRPRGSRAEEGAGSYPNYIALRRNEVKDKAPSDKTVASWAAGKKNPEPIWADGDSDSLGTDQKGRTQRQTIALKNVHYRLHAKIRPWPGHEHELVAFEACFRRRASHGKCVYQPYFGCREFPAYFELVEPDAPSAERLPVSIEVGLMLYDVFDLSRPGTCHDEPCISLFRAIVTGGVLTVPRYESEEVLKGARREQ